VITGIRRVDLVSSIDLEDVIIGINDTDITDLSFTQVIALMKAIPSDSNVKLRIRRPEHKKRKIVNMDKWVASAVGKGQAQTNDDEYTNDDRYVDVQVVFSMPLTSAGDVDDDIMLTDEQLDVPSPMANKPSSESLIKGYVRRRSSHTLLQNRSVGNSDVDVIQDSLQATHMSATPNTDDSWKLLSVDSFPEIASKSIVGGDDDDSFQNAVEDVFKRLNGHKAEFIQLDPMVSVIRSLAVPLDVQNQLVSLCKEISLDGYCMTREGFLLWFQGHESRKDLLSILSYVAKFSGQSMDL